jgi:hypothetical protein
MLNKTKKRFKTIGIGFSFQKDRSIKNIKNRFLFGCSFYRKRIFEYSMNFLFLGDIVGRSGRDIVLSELPKVKANEEIDFVIVNGENAAGGYGITKKICDELFSVGVDVITSGNHIWDQKETADFISVRKKIIKTIKFYGRYSRFWL